MRKVLLIIIVILIHISTFAQSAFEMRYSQALDQFDKGRYSAAVQIINRAMSDAAGLSEAQLSKLRDLKNRCSRELAKANAITLSHDKIQNVSFEGAVDSVTFHVPSGKIISANTSQDWIKTSISDTLLVVVIEKNSDHEDRTGRISVSVPGGSVSYIDVSQDAMPEISRKIIVNTNPSLARVLFDGEPVTHMVVAGYGNHIIHAEQFMHESVDTTIVIDERVYEDDLIVNINLKRLFSIANVKVSSEDNELIPYFRITIDDVEVASKVAYEESLDDVDRVHMYKLYKEGFAIAGEQVHNIKVFAEGYEDSEFSFVPHVGEYYEIPITLDHRKGFLDVSSGSCSDSTIVAIDGKLVGFVPLERYPLKVGEHRVSFIKDGYVSIVGEHSVNIEEGINCSLQADMIGYDTYEFIDGEPENTSVYVDGKYAGLTPCNVILTQGTHEISYQKDGYMSASLELYSSGRNFKFSTSHSLMKAYPLMLKSDEDGLRASISKGGKVVIDTAKTNSIIYLPIGNGPHHVRIFRNIGGKEKLAVKGVIHFDRESQESVRFNTWSKYIFQIIGADYYASGSGQSIVYDKAFHELGDAYIGKMQIVKGLSTNILKSHFLQSSDDKQIVERESAVKPSILPSFSFLFLNADLRLGGALSNWIDLNLLGTYAWYLDMTHFLPVSHISGHDVFAGLELSSRLPVFTMNIKAGYHILLNGQSHIFSAKSFQMSNVSKYFMPAVSLNPEGNEGSFILSVGFSLSGKKSKGNNVLRFF